MSRALPRISFSTGPSAIPPSWRGSYLAAPAAHAHLSRFSRSSSPRQRQCAVLSLTVTSSEIAFAVANSGLPSPLKSPVATP